MFINEKKENQNEYILLLKAAGSLSNLFSENKAPYLYYRAHENIFCEALEAENLSRSDCSADAKKGRVGIGLKTFLNGNGRTFQKVAEFNKERHLYADLTGNKLAEKVSELRNKRIQSTMAVHGIYKMIYHCTAREEGKFIIFEEEMDQVDIRNIHVTNSRKNTIQFTDGIHEYNFNISKSTLMKRFYTRSIEEFEVHISENVYEMLKNLHEEIKVITKVKQSTESVILPLYSFRSGKVEEKSGLNQWNAGGRKRHPNEVYIPVVSWIHSKFPNFFPDVTKGFNLHLPNGNILSAKMCQKYEIEKDGVKINKGKGLMSNPNRDLGEWILRDILKLEKGTLVTYETLEEVGIDSVEIEKIDSENYKVNFKHLGAFQEFYDENEYVFISESN